MKRYPEDIELGDAGLDRGSCPEIIWLGPLLNAPKSSGFFLAFVSDEAQSEADTGLRIHSQHGDFPGPISR
jgi:hypothetical protein